MDKFCEERFKLNEENIIVEDEMSKENISSKNYTNKSVWYENIWAAKNKDLMIHTGFSPQIYQNIGLTYDEFMKIQSFDSAMLISPGIPMSTDCQKSKKFN